MSEHIDELAAFGTLDEARFTELLKFRNIETTAYLFEKAVQMRQQVHQRLVPIFGRIMISNYCKKDCGICGIRRENRFVHRFRLSKAQILSYCEYFVSQKIEHLLLESGEDSYLTEASVTEFITVLKEKYPNIHIYLSLGEKRKATYQRWKEVGAEGYFISHGTADGQHFKKIFPSNVSLLVKKQHLWELKDLRYQIGSGLVIGLPYQMIHHIVDDLFFLKQLAPSYLSVRAFIPAEKGVFADQKSGNGEMALYILAILRLMLPSCHLLAETTLDCVLKDGRVYSFDAGADVLLLDIPDLEQLNRYGVYERKHRRLALSPDDINTWKEQLRIHGLVPE